MPNYLISYSDHKVVLRNYEGYITTYEEPETYERHDSSACAYCQHERPEPGQSGILGLLEGERMWIEPKGFSEIHTRGNTEAHRLQDPSKWVPFGRRCDRGNGRIVAARPRGGRSPGRWLREWRRSGPGVRTRRGAPPARGRAHRVRSRRVALASFRLWGCPLHAVQGLDNALHQMHVPSPDAPASRRRAILG